MATVVGVVGIVVTVAAVAWILVARTPDHDEAFDTTGEPDERDASQYVAGPAGPGAEDQVPPGPLDPGRRDDPGERST
jgi:hypothetical protein